MKQVLQQVSGGEIEVVDVPAPKLLAGCVLVRTAASLVSVGTERASSEFARKNLLQKARMRPDLVREVWNKVRRDGVVSALTAVRSRMDQPSAPGYSSAGTVVAVGEGVTDIRPGDRVACAGAGSDSSVGFFDACMQQSGGRGMDAVLISAQTTSSDPVNLAAEVARDRAVIVAVGTVGMALERKHFYEKELDFRVSRSYGPGRYDAAYEQKGVDYPIGSVRWTETR